MELLQHVHSETEFQNELINRFFHHNSYFFHCVSHHLDCELDSNDNTNNEDYLLFGNLMDKLVNAQNKVSELETLATIGAFNKFHHNLISTIKYLRETDLDQEQMKIEIESLAQFLVSTALSAIHNNKIRADIKHFLGIKIHESDDGMPEEVKEAEDEKNLLEDINDTITQIEGQELGHLDTQQGITTEALENDSAPKFAEPPSEVLIQPEQLTLENPSDFSESDDKEEKDILRDLKAGMEASVEDAIDSGLTKEGGSAFILPQRTSQGAEIVNKQPESFIKVFINKIESQINTLQNTITLLKEHPENKEPWLNCINLFDTIKESAMIYGLEAFEQVASKAQKYFSTVLKQPLRDFDNDLTLLTETKNVLKELILGDLEKIDEKVIKNLIQKFNQPKGGEFEDTSDVITKPSEDLIFKTKKNDTDNEPNEKTYLNDTSSETPISQNTMNTQSDFKLPGEDDEEIQNLVKEITNNGETENAPKERETSCTETEAIQKVLEDVLTQSPEDKLKLFKDEAELYFNIIDEALKTLELQPENKTALDDLELASYSVYGLTVKLDLEPLGQLFEAIERLVKNKISKKSSLSKTEHTIIKDVFKSLHNILQKEDIEKHQIKKLLTLIQELNSAIQRESHGDRRLDNEVETTEESNEETMPTNQNFRLKSKSFISNP